MHLSIEKIRSLLKSRDLQEKKLKDIPPPSLLKDATKSAERIKNAINNGENISLIGDYDVDGMIATTIVTDFFKQIGYPLDAIVPDRFTDGYGLSKSAIDKLHDPKVVITVDNGIAAVNASKYCKEKGIDLIITDHHKVGGELPNAYSIVNPKQDDCNYPFDDICGAFVAWLFCAEIKRVLNIDVNLSKYIPLVAITTISDIMPLININRAVVKQGLKQFKDSKIDSIKYLYEKIGKESLLSDDIAFFIAPRLNSSGRLRHGQITVDFLLADSSSLDIKFNEINEINNERKEIELEIVDSILKEADDFGDKSFIIASSENWHEGVIGIVASKIATAYKKPTLILNKNGDIYKGSGRSYGDIDIYSILLKYREFFLKFGGHKSAVGLSIDIKKFDEFKTTIEHEDIETIESSGNDVVEVEIADINMDMLRLINKYEPYGNANIKPSLLLKDVTVSNCKTFVHKHKKITVTSDHTHYIDVLDFNSKDTYTKGETVSFKVNLSYSSYSKSIEAILQDK